MILCCQLFDANSSKSTVPGKQVVFTYIGQCSGKDDLPILVHPWDITREGKNNYFVGGNVTIKEDIVDGFDSKIYNMIEKLN